jgi:hypothetical protein
MTAEQLKNLAHKETEDLVRLLSDWIPYSEQYDHIMNAVQQLRCRINGIEDADIK